ncbi:hypothetical protein GW796_05930 [archaeon]|nr:hypothetical protein [archaeon]NCQ51423.1 hypothetical protein [archaeon]NCT58751.1 hypothetical protein [archaeon]
MNNENKFNKKKSLINSRIIKYIKNIKNPSISSFANDVLSVFNSITISDLSSQEGIINDFVKKSLNKTKKYVDDLNKTNPLEKPKLNADLKMFSLVTDSVTKSFITLKKYSNDGNFKKTVGLTTGLALGGVLENPSLGIIMGKGISSALNPVETAKTMKEKFKETKEELKKKSSKELALHTGGGLLKGLGALTESPSLLLGGSKLSDLAGKHKQKRENLEKLKEETNDIVSKNLPEKSKKGFGNIIPDDTKEDLKEEIELLTANVVDILDNRTGLLEDIKDLEENTPKVKTNKSTEEKENIEPLTTKIVDILTIHTGLLENIRDLQKRNIENNEEIERDRELEASPIKTNLSSLKTEESTNTYSGIKTKDEENTSSITNTILKGLGLVGSGALIPTITTALTTALTSTILPAIAIGAGASVLFPKIEDTIIDIEKNSKSTESLLNSLDLISTNEKNDGWISEGDIKRREAIEKELKRRGVEYEIKLIEKSGLLGFNKHTEEKRVQKNIEMTNSHSKNIDNEVVSPHSKNIEMTNSHSKNIEMVSSHSKNIDNEVVSPVTYNQNKPATNNVNNIVQNTKNTTNNTEQYKIKEELNRQNSVIEKKEPQINNINSVTQSSTSKTKPIISILTGDVNSFPSRLVRTY